MRGAEGDDAAAETERFRRSVATATQLAAADERHCGLTPPPARHTIMSEA